MLSVQNPTCQNSQLYFFMYLMAVKGDAHQFQLPLADFNAYLTTIFLHCCLEPFSTMKTMCKYTAFDAKRYKTALLCNYYIF